jgi:multisubunit Na+/H+ antiporter MnhE subunit
MGPVIFLAQLVLFPFLSNRFSALALWRASAVTFAVVYPIFSLLPQLEVVEQRTIETVRWIMLLGLLAVRFTANVIAYTSIAVLVRRSPSCSKRRFKLHVPQVC